MTKRASTVAAMEDSVVLIDPTATDDGLPERAVLVVAEEGVPTSDRRGARPGALSWRDGPLSLTISHGDVSDLVGRIDRFDRIDDVEGLTPANYLDRVGDAGRFVVGLATFDLATELGREAARQVRDKFLRGVSMEVGDEVVEMEWEQGCDPDAEMCVGVEWLASAEIGAVSLVTFPAFASGEAIVDEEPTVEVVPPADPAPELALPVEEKLPAALLAALTIPPAGYFEDPGLEQPTGIQIEEDGRIYGHLAIWGVAHIGLPGRYAEPSPSGYHYFRTGKRLTSEGLVDVGVLTMETGHENDLYASLDQAVSHYDDTGTQVATVNIGEDRFGIWIAGALLSDVTPEHLERFRASGRLSGDWRPVGRDLELCAALVVNTPGFGIPPTRRAVAAGGQPLALVAAPGPCLGTKDRPEEGDVMAEDPTADPEQSPDETAPEEAPAEEMVPPTVEELAAKLDSADERVGLLESRVEELEAVVATLGLPAQAVESLVSALGTRSGAVRPHGTATTDLPWNGPAARVRVAETPDYYRRAYAYHDPDGPGRTTAFLHHEIAGDGTPGAASLSACETGIAILNGARRGTAQIPDGDLQGIYDHLARHLRDGGLEPAPATFALRTPRDA